MVMEGLVVAMLVMEGGGGVLATARGSLVMGEGELLRLMITGWSVMMNRSLLSQGEGNFKYEKCLLLSDYSRRELSDILTTRQSTTTPYLLFYSRM